MDKLTTHQQEQMDKAIPLLKEFKTVLIRGEPGVGKTFCAEYLITEAKRTFFKGKPCKILCTATTNNATTVLSNKVDIEGNIEFSTIHKGLKYQGFRNYKTKETVFKPSFIKGKEPLKDVNILVIDEAGMTDKFMLSHIVAYTTRFNIFLILLGDKKQLPPVNEKVSRVFEMFKHCTVTLTEIIRQKAGNTIPKLRKNPELLYTGVADLVGTEDGIVGYAFESDIDVIIDKLTKVDPMKVKYLAYLNKTVNTVNKAVRKKKYGKPDKYELGEVLLFASPYQRGAYKTNQEIKVLTLTIEDRTFIRGKVFKCFVINDDILVLYKGQSVALREFKKTLTPKESWDLGDKFAVLKYTHAITVHRSQGMTLDMAILDVGDINTSYDRSLREKLLETGRSRPSKLLIITNW